MNDENLHITPNPQDGFPEPEIPVDKAWNEMSRLLDAEMPSPPPPGDGSPVVPPTNGAGGLPGSSFLYWTIAVVVTGIIGWVTLELLNRTDENAGAPEPSGTVATLPVQPSKTPVLQSNQPETPVFNIKESSEEQRVPVEKPMPVVNSRTVSETSNPIRQPADDRAPAPVMISGDPTPMEQVTNAPAVTAADSSFITPPIAPPATSSDTTPVYSPAGPGTGEGPAGKTGDEKPAVPETDTVQPVPAESGHPARAPGNLQWFARADGNVGMVYRKERDPNLFYGGIFSAGLWHQKLNAGIETGIGWENYHDYGSITNYIRITDSIPGDSLNPVIYTDTTQVTAYQYRYQYLQLPLFISKQLLDRGSFALDLRTGPVLGILVSEKHMTDYMTGPGEGEVTGTQDNDYERLKFSWQWHIMVQVRWDLSDRLSLTLSPAGIFYLNDLYGKRDTPPGTPFGISLTGGLIIRF